MQLETLRGVSEDIGDLQCKKRLSQAQDFYVSRGRCPGAKKEMLLKMHSSYRARGRNQLVRALRGRNIAASRQTAGKLKEVFGK